MLSSTPGTSSGSQINVLNRLNGLNRLNRQERFGGGVRFGTNVRARPITSVAAAVANQKEFQIAFPFAATAPGNSVQVRFRESSSSRGTPTASRHTRSVQTPQNQNQFRRSCCRNNAGAAGPSSRGQGNSRSLSQISNSSGASTKGQLNRNAPSVSKLVLKRTHTSA